MVRIILLFSILIQIAIALTQEGWLCYAAQLSAFLSCMALALSGSQPFTSADRDVSLDSDL